MRRLPDRAMRWDPVHLELSEACPAPGSDSAIAAGCFCPVIDNARGRGYLAGEKDADGRVLYLVFSGCELHGSALQASALGRQREA